MMNNVYRRKIKIVEDTINEIINNIEYNGGSLSNSVGNNKFDK